MRRSTISALGTSLALLLACSGLLAHPISYQGRVTENGDAATGAYEVRFQVFPAAAGGAQVGPTVARSTSLTQADNGIVSFTDLDFGDGVFTGAPRWLEVAFRAVGDPTFTVLLPRQPVSFTPYAVYAAGSGTTLNQAHQNGPVIANATGAALQVDGAIRAGNPASHGVFQIFQAGTAGRVIQLYNLSGQGGSIRLFSEAGDTIAFLEADGNGTGALFRLQGNGGFLDWDADTGAGPNTGGRFSITGPASGLVFDTALTGDGSFVVPGSSIGSAEVIDEPGVASENRPTGALLTASIATVTSRSITVPGPGFVIAWASCSMAVQRASDANGLLTIGLSDQPNTFLNSQQMVLQMPPSQLTFGQYNFPGSAHAVFPIAGAGTYTYYFNGRASGFGNPQLFDSTITLLYVPTGYGLVSPALLAPDGGYDISDLSAPTLSREQIHAEQLAEQRRALDELRAEQARLRKELESIRSKVSEQ